MEVLIILYFQFEITRTLKISQQDLKLRHIYLTWLSLNCISMRSLSSTSTVSSWPRVIMRIGPSPNIAPRIGVNIDPLPPWLQLVPGLWEGLVELVLAVGPLAFREACCCFWMDSHQRVTSARNSATRSVENSSITVCNKTIVGLANTEQFYDQQSVINELES